MNIFYTSQCPTEAAIFLDNKRVVKMVLESAQMLSTAINEYGGKGFYKSTHKNHPCNVWLRQSKYNYLWLAKHFESLCKEYTKRYGKIHKCQQYLEYIYKNVDLLPDVPQTPHPNCAANKEKGISYKHIGDTVMAYQLYLNDRWETDKLEPKFS